MTGMTYKLALQLKEAGFPQNTETSGKFQGPPKVNMACLYE